MYNANYIYILTMKLRPLRIGDLQGGIYLLYNIS